MGEPTTVGSCLLFPSDQRDQDGPVGPGPVYSDRNQPTSLCFGPTPTSCSPLFSPPSYAGQWIPVGPQTMQLLPATGSHPGSKNLKFETTSKICPTKESADDLDCLSSSEFGVRTLLLPLPFEIVDELRPISHCSLECPIFYPISTSR